MGELKKLDEEVSTMEEQLSAYTVYMVHRANEIDRMNKETFREMSIRLDGVLEIIHPEKKKDKMVLKRLKRVIKNFI